MNAKRYSEPCGKDPLSELYDVASALRFLEDAFDGQDQAGSPIRATGAAYVAGLMGRRVNAIACSLWDQERPRPPLADPAPSPAAPPDDPASRRKPSGSNLDK